MRVILGRSTVAVRLAAPTYVLISGLDAHLRASLNCPWRQLYNHGMKRVVHAACPHDCPDACGVLITVEEGRATKIQGDPEHPMTRGFLCAKVAKYLDRVYSPDRVLYPMKRAGPKGPCGTDAPTHEIFQRITWDEALDEIAARFRQIIAEHGPEAILPYSYGGTLGALNGASMDRRFFHRLGASQLERTICSTPARWACNR